MQQGRVHYTDTGASYGAPKKQVGVCKIPLSYVTRADLIVPTIGTIYATFPYSEGVDSFHNELITRASRTHPNFADDNGMVLDV